MSRSGRLCDVILRWRHILLALHRSSLPAWRREGTVLTAGRTSWMLRKPWESDKKRGERAHRDNLSAWFWLAPEASAMSSSRQFSESKAIPTRTVLINDTTQLPHDYCTTPGGTLFSTTPGGNNPGVYLQPFARCLCGDRLMFRGCPVLARKP